MPKDERSDSQSRWVNDTHKARRYAMEIRRQIPPEYTHTAPFDVPELVDYFNRILFEYTSHLRPKREDMEEIWEEEITTVQVPSDGSSIDIGSTNHRGQFDAEKFIYDAPWEPREVSLNSLQKLWVAENRVSVTVSGNDPWSGPIEQKITKVLHLPIWAGNLVLQQADDCLNKMGWLPQVDSTPRTEITEEMIEEVEAWRQRQLAD